MQVWITYTSGEQSMIRVDDAWEEYELVTAMEGREDVTSVRLSGEDASQ